MAALVLSALLTAALPPDEVLTQAEQAFQQGKDLRSTPRQARPHFAQAARHYEDLWQRGHRSAALALDEGNAALLADDLPRAVLAYRRGLRLDPNGRELRENLAYAREQVTYPQGSRLGRPPLDHWPPWLPRPTAGWLLVATGLALTAFCAAWTRWSVTHRDGSLTTAVLLGLVGLVPATALVAEEVRLRSEVAHPVAVIADDGVLLHRGNGFDYPLRNEAPLNRGVEARVLFGRGDWVQLELAGGEVGWVPRAYVLVDEP